MVVAKLIGDDGTAVDCWEPSPGVFLACSEYTAEQAKARGRLLASNAPWTPADVASHRATGFAVGAPPINHGAYV